MLIEEPEKFLTSLSSPQPLRGVKVKIFNILICIITFCFSSNPLKDVAQFVSIIFTIQSEL
jgi:hypothetical protein